MSYTDTEVEITRLIIESGALELKQGDDAFVYSSGHRGPGYLQVKGLVGQPKVLDFLIKSLAEKVNNVTGNNLDFIDGNVTGGVVFGFHLSRKLGEIQKRTIPFVYLRGSRKEGGHNELITGDMNNPLIKKGMNVLVVEELVNFGQTTMNAINVFRREGYKVNYAACVVSYDYYDMRKNLEKMNVDLISLITLPKLLEIAKAKSMLPNDTIDSYIEYLRDPIGWQQRRRYAIPESGLEEAHKIGYVMKLVQPKYYNIYKVPLDKVKHTKYYMEECYMPSNNTELIVALDFDDINKIENIIDYMKCCSTKNKFGYKLNLDSVLFNYEQIKQIIQKIKNNNQIVFIDLKMWNGIRTMQNIIQNFVDLKVDIINVYGHIGPKEIAALSKITRGTNTKLFVLTVLTHYDEKYTNDLYGKPIEQVIKCITKWALDNGADGLILPGPYLNSVQDVNLLKLCPAVRPVWFQEKNTNNQVQICTPTEARNNGADYVVVGSPITKDNSFTEMEIAICKILIELATPAKL